MSDFVINVPYRTTVEPRHDAAGQGIAYRKNLVIHAAVVAILGGLLLLDLNPGGLLIVGGLVIGPLFSWFMMQDARRSPLWVTPMVFYFFWQTLCLGVAPIYMGTQVYDGSATPYGFGAMVTPDQFARGYMIALVGTVFFHWGLAFWRPKEEHFVIEEVSREQVQRYLPRLAILFGMGMVGLAPVIARNVGVIASAFQFGAHAALLSFVAIPRSRLKLNDATCLGIVLGGAFILGIASLAANSKLYLALVLLPVIGFVANRAAYKKYLPLGGVVLLLLYLTVLAPVINVSRLDVTSHRTDPTTAKIEAFKRNSPLYTGKITWEFYEGQGRQLLSRLFEASAIGYIVGEVEVRGHLEGETMQVLRYAFIPRLLWPDKPYVVQGAWQTKRLGGAATESAATVSLGMEAAGELYWNFGLWGVIPGMFILGSTFGLLWRMAGANPQFDAVKSLLYYQVAIGTLNLPEFTSRIVSFVALALLFGAILLLRPKGKRSRGVIFSRLGPA